MTDKSISTPASFVPLEALAFGTVGAAATPVGPDNPLPVRTTTPPAGSTPLVGTAAANGAIGPFTPDLGRPINLTLSGTWAGTVTVKRSVDGGATKLPLTVAGQPWGVFSANVQEPILEESEAGATFYLDFAWTSGTLAYRVSQ